MPRLLSREKDSLLTNIWRKLYTHMQKDEMDLYAMCKN